MSKVIKIRGKKNSNTNCGPEVEMTKHFLQRCIERRSDLFKKSEATVRARLEHELKHSRLVAIRGNEEHRSFQSHIYICKREKGKLVAITYVYSSTHKKINELHGYRKAS